MPGPVLGAVEKGLQRQVTLQPCSRGALSPKEKGTSRGVMLRHENTVTSMNQPVVNSEN